MTTLLKQLGRIPYHYKATQPNDYQVTIDGPAGPAVITRLDDGGYEVETTFPGIGIRLHYDLHTPREAMEKVIEVNTRRLVILGVEIPSKVSPWRDPLSLLLGVLVVACVAWVGWVTYAHFASDDGTPRPVAPVTWAPSTPLTLYGDSQYAGSINLAPTTLETPR